MKRRNFIAGAAAVPVMAIAPLQAYSALTKESAAELPTAVMSLHVGPPPFPGFLLADYSTYRCLSVVIPEGYKLLRGKSCVLEGPFDFPVATTTGKLITHVSLTMRNKFQAFGLTPFINVGPYIMPRIDRLEFTE